MLADDQRTTPVLPTDSDERKTIPIFSGVLNYFPLAIAAVARVSKRGNDKHNPGQPLHWSRGKSMDHEDCIARHLVDVHTVSRFGEFEDAAALAWRALALLQALEEQRLGKPVSRGSSEPAVISVGDALGEPIGEEIEIEIVDEFEPFSPETRMDEGRASGAV